MHLFSNFIYIYILKTILFYKYRYNSIFNNFNSRSKSIAFNNETINLSLVSKNFNKFIKSILLDLLDVSNQKLLKQFINYNNNHNNNNNNNDNSPKLINYIHYKDYEIINSNNNNDPKDLIYGNIDNKSGNINSGVKNSSTQIIYIDIDLNREWKKNNNETAGIICLEDLQSRKYSENVHFNIIIGNHYNSHRVIFKNDHNNNINLFIQGEYLPLKEVIRFKPKRVVYSPKPPIYCVNCDFSSLFESNSIELLSISELYPVNLKYISLINNSTSKLRSLYISIAFHSILKQLALENGTSLSNELFGIYSYNSDPSISSFSNCELYENIFKSKYWYEMIETLKTNSTITELALNNPVCSNFGNCVINYDKTLLTSGLKDLLSSQNSITTLKFGNFDFIDENIIQGLELNKIIKNVSFVFDHSSFKMVNLVFERLLFNKQILNSIEFESSLDLNYYPQFFKKYPNIQLYSISIYLENFNSNDITQFMEDLPSPVNIKEFIFYNREKCYIINK